MENLIHNTDQAKIFECKNEVIFECDEETEKDYVFFFNKYNCKRSIKGDKIRWSFEKTNIKMLGFLNDITSEKLENYFTKEKKEEKKIYATERYVTVEKTLVTLFPINNDHYSMEISSKIKISDYTAKSYVLYCGVEWVNSEYKNMTHKKKLEISGCIFNSKLDTDDGDKKPGWIIAKSNKAAITFLKELTGVDFPCNNTTTYTPAYNNNSINKTVNSTSVSQTIFDKFCSVFNELEVELNKTQEKIIDDKLIIMGNKNDVDKAIFKKENYEVAGLLENSRNKIVILREF